VCKTAADGIGNARITRGSFRYLCLKLLHLSEKLSVSISPEFRRVISRRALLSPGLLPATVAGLISSVLLAATFVLLGALCWLLISVESGNTQGLLPLTEALSSHVVGPWAAKLIRSIPVLHATNSAALCLMLCLSALMPLRWGLGSLATTRVYSYVDRAAVRLRQHIHRKAIRLEPADLTGEQTRHADRLFQAETRTLAESAAKWGQLWVVEVPELLAAIMTAIVINWRIALQTVIPVVIGRMILRREAQRGDSSLRLLLEQVDRGLARMAESLRKTRIVTTFGMEQTEQQQFESHLGDYQVRCRQLAWQQSIGRGIRNLIWLIVVLLPAAILLMHCLRGYSVAAMVVSGVCLLMVYRQLIRIEGLPALSAEGSDKAEEIAAYLNRIPSVSQTPGAVFLEPMSRTLTFNQVSFQTPQLPGLLDGFDLRISSGERIALLSLHPASAYAVASMIPRLLDPDMGQVLIDGRDIRQATLESLRAESIFVGGQDPVFNATVVENITCGQTDITRQQAVDAAKLVHADQFLRTLPKGYDTVLGEHGASLDPGQMFRLNLARAIVRQPALLVIEEPPLPLDAETKALLDDAYQRISGSRTLIFLPHRLSTVKRCSRVVLIHDGQVVADGTHDLLVKASDLYRHWEYIRFNPFRDDAES
jgi:ATP-binding cassette subfamily B protein